MAISPWRLTASAAAAGLAVTAAVASLPFLRFAYLNPRLHLVLESIEGVVGIFVGYLIFGRFRQQRRVSDLLLAYALLVFGATNICLSAFVEGLGHTGPFSTWAPLSARSVAVLAFGAAPFFFDRYVTRSVEASVRLAMAVIATLASVSLIVLLLEGRLPEGVGEVASASDFARPNFDAHPAVLLAQLTSLAAFSVAAVAFTRLAIRRDDDLLRWVGAGAALSATARINYFLLPSLYTDYVYVGDLLRFGFYTLLLIGASRELQRYWHQLAEVAVHDERRRIARELHDGLAQELVFIAGQTRRVRRGKASDSGVALDQIASAADRAVGEARRAIAALAEDVDEPLDAAIRKLTDQMHLDDVHLTLTLDRNVRVQPLVKENLLRIAREAINNAVRHAEPRTVAVNLSQEDGIRLDVSDDGRGFDPGEAAAGGGFGLTSMKERVAALGGDLTVSSHQGKGTKVEVVIP